MTVRHYSGIDRCMRYAEERPVAGSAVKKNRASQCVWAIAHSPHCLLLEQEQILLLLWLYQMVINWHNNNDNSANTISTLLCICQR